MKSLVSSADQIPTFHIKKQKKIIGIVDIIKEHFLDKTDRTHKFVSIIVRALYPLKRE